MRSKAFQVLKKTSTKPFSFSLAIDPSLKRPNENTVYFDVQATSQMDPRVVDKMLPYMTKFFANPHSKSHDLGKYAANGIEEARQVP